MTRHNDEEPSMKKDKRPGTGGRLLAKVLPEFVTRLMGQ